MFLKCHCVVNSVSFGTAFFCCCRANCGSNFRNPGAPSKASNARNAAAGSPSTRATHNSGAYSGCFKSRTPAASSFRRVSARPSHSTKNDSVSNRRFTSVRTTVPLGYNTNCALPLRLAANASASASSNSKSGCAGIDRSPLPSFPPDSQISSIATSITTGFPPTLIRHCRPGIKGASNATPAPTRFAFVAALSAANRVSKDSDFPPPLSSATSLASTASTSFSISTASFELESLARIPRTSPSCIPKNNNPPTTAASIQIPKTTRCLIGERS